MTQPAPKPEFLRADQAAAFEDIDVARSYRNRPGYAAAVFDTLIALMPGYGPILDIGCGTGFLARPLAERGFPVDAIDISPSMIEQGRAMPAGDLPHLRLQAVRAAIERTGARQVVIQRVTEIVWGTPR